MPGAKDKGSIVLARLLSPAHNYTVFKDLVTEWQTHVTLVKLNLVYIQTV